MRFFFAAFFRVVLRRRRGVAVPIWASWIFVAALTSPMFGITPGLCGIASSLVGVRVVVVRF